MSTPQPRADGGGPVVDVRGLAAGYGDTLVFSDVSFSVAHRETMVVVGASGCGKSTLLRCLVGLLKPTRGSVSVMGSDFWALSETERDRERRQMGVAFQSSALLNSLTVGENVALPLREHTALDDETIRVMTRMKLEQVGLRGAGDRLPSELSGGMRKRAGIARALAMDPKVLFLDEPSAGLDPITAAGLDALMVSLRTALGLTLIVVTHELQSIHAVADRVLMLDKGSVRVNATLAEIAASKDPRVRQFFDRLPEPEVSDAGALVNELTRETT